MFHPASLCRRIDAVDRGVRLRFEVHGAAADEGRGEAPSQGDENDGDDVVEDGRRGVCRGRGGIRRSHGVEIRGPKGW